jgi:hypothetical protein
MEVSYIDGVRNEVMLHNVKEGRNILQTIKRRRVTTWSGHILRSNSLLKHITEGNREERKDGKTK